MTDGPFRTVELHPDWEHVHVALIVGPERKLVEWMDANSPSGPVRVLLLSCAHRLILKPAPTDAEPVLDSIWSCKECGNDALAARKAGDA